MLCRVSCAQTLTINFGAVPFEYKALVSPFCESLIFVVFMIELDAAVFLDWGRPAVACSSEIIALGAHST
jgi:hypothetical protein